MADYGTRLGLDAISSVVLAVLKDTPAGAGLSPAEESVRRLEKLLLDELALPA